MKKYFKIIVMIFIIVLFISLSPYKVEARGIFEQAHDFLEEGSKEVGMLSESTQANKKITSMFSKIFGLGDKTRSGFEQIIDLLWSIGLLVIFISTIILGIKYMFVLPEERSRIKQATTPYVLGVVIIFGAVTIWRFIIVVLDGSLN